MNRWDGKHGTCVASEHVNSFSIVLAPTAHHVVLEIGLSHVQGRVDLHLLMEMRMWLRDLVRNSKTVRQKIHFTVCQQTNALLKCDWGCGETVFVAQGLVPPARGEGLKQFVSGVRGVDPSGSWRQVAEGRQIASMMEMCPESSDIVGSVNPVSTTMLAALFLGNWTPHTSS